MRRNGYDRIPIRRVALCSIVRLLSNSKSKSWNGSRAAHSCSQPAPVPTAANIQQTCEVGRERALLPLHSSLASRSFCHSVWRARRPRYAVCVSYAFNFQCRCMKYGRTTRTHAHGSRGRGRTDGRRQSQCQRTRSPLPQPPQRERERGRKRERKRASRRGEGGRGRRCQDASIGGASTSVRRPFVLPPPHNPSPLLLPVRPSVPTEDDDRYADARKRVFKRFVNLRIERGRAGRMKRTALLLLSSASVIESDSLLVLLVVLLVLSSVQCSAYKRYIAPRTGDRRDSGARPAPRPAGQEHDVEAGVRQPRQLQRRRSVLRRVRR